MQSDQCFHSALLILSLLPGSNLLAACCALGQDTICAVLWPPLTPADPWPLSCTPQNSPARPLVPTPPPFSLNMGTPWQLIDNITAREDTLQVEIKNIFRWKVIVDFYEMNKNMIKYFMNVSLYFEAVLLLPLWTLYSRYSRESSECLKCGMDGI